MNLAGLVLGLVVCSSTSLAPAQCGDCTLIGTKSGAKAGWRQKDKEAETETIQPELADIEPEEEFTDFGLLASSVGATPGGFSAAPNMIGDFFGGGASRITITNTVQHNFYVRGYFAPGSPGGSGDANAVLVFETSGGTPNDFTTNGIGSDASGDGLADTFPMAEPIPPNNAPVSPGPTYSFDGGTVVWTNSAATTAAQDGFFDDGDTWYASYGFSEQIVVAAGTGGALVRRMKLSENNSPEPRDRIYGFYNFFSHVPTGVGDVHRFTPGIEKTFCDGLMSIDLRFPFASTLSSTQIANGSENGDTEFGNVTAIWKSILAQTPNVLVSGGIGLAFPTADGTRVALADGTPILNIENEAVHVLPFGAVLWTPDERSFVQGFLQFDLDANGNNAFGGMSGTLPSLGRLHDASLMYFDISVGRWYYRSPHCAGVSAVAPVVELHYSTTLQDEETLTGNGIEVRPATRRFDVLNITIGTHLAFGERLVITPGVALPLRDDDDHQFACEAMVLANWYY